jgi:CRISPR/Cas system endoribonuclease Cas6 (RAMP superfamily)
VKVPTERQRRRLALMPTTFKMRLQLKAPPPRTPHLGASANAVLLSLLEQDDRQLANDLHSANPKPYSLALADSQGFGGVEGRSLEVRLQVLDEVLEARINAALVPGMVFGSSVEPLYGEIVEVNREFQSYQALVEQALDAPLERQIQLDFLTSTLLSGNDNRWPLPIPGYLFGGLLRRFEHFSGFTFGGTFHSYINRSVQCIHYKAEPYGERLSSKEYHAGFIGKAIFVAAGPAQSARSLLALAQFAQWSGVGINTSFGCGQVVVTSQEAVVRDERGEVLELLAKA